MLIQLTPAKQFPSAFWACFLVSSWKSEHTLRVRGKKTSCREAQGEEVRIQFPSQEEILSFCVILIDTKLEETSWATESRLQNLQYKLWYILCMPSTVAVVQWSSWDDTWFTASEMTSCCTHTITLASGDEFQQWCWLSLLYAIKLSHHNSPCSPESDSFPQLVSRETL